MPIHQVFFHHNVDQPFFHDVNTCQSLILLQSPFATVRRLQHFQTAFKDCARRGVRVCAFLQEPRSFSDISEAQREARVNAIAFLKSLGVHVNMRPRIHEKIIIIDEAIAWEGSMNFLSYLDTKERINRWVGRDCVDEMIINHALDTCEICRLSPGFGPIRDENTGLLERELLGKMIAERRKSLGMTQRELVRRSGVCHRIICAVEAGTADPCVSTLQRICSPLGFALRCAPWMLLPSIDAHSAALYKRQYLPAAGETAAYIKPQPSAGLAATQKLAYAHRSAEKDGTRQ